MVRYKQCCNFPPIPGADPPKTQQTAGSLVPGIVPACYTTEIQPTSQGHFHLHLPRAQTTEALASRVHGDFHFVACLGRAFLEKGPWSASASERRRPVSASVPASQCTPVTGNSLRKRLPTALMHPLAQCRKASVPFMNGGTHLICATAAHVQLFFLSTPVVTLT